MSNETKSTTQHTPGPWRAESFFVYADQYVTVAAAYADSPDERIANARLIAAAPEMYAALVAMERIIVELYPGHVEPDPEHVGEYQAVWGAVQDARAAIAKAVQA